MEEEWSRKKKKKGWDVFLNKEEQGKGGGKKYLLQEWVRLGGKKPDEQNDVSRVPQYFLQTLFPNVCCISQRRTLKISQFCHFWPLFSKYGIV